MFRNRYKAILASFLFGTLFTACVDDNVLDNEQVADMPTIQLRLSTDDLTTRAVTGNSAFTDIEKKMNTVFLYLFSYDATEASTPLKRVCLTDKKHGDKSTVTISTDSVSIVFGAAKKCRVYAVVNVSVDDFKAADVDTLKPTLKKLRELRAKTTTFSDKFNGFAMFTKDEKGDEITYDDTNRTAEGTVKLKNLASKIDIFASFGDGNEIVEGVDPTGTLDGVRKWKLYKGTTDKPNEVYIVNGVQTVPLNGWSEQDYADGKLTAELSGTDYFDTRSPKTDNHFLKSSDETDKDKYPWVIAEPFYSYPNQWSNDAFEQHQTYLMLKVNWLPYEEDSPNVEDEIVETYYKIPVNVTDGTTIKSKDKLLSNVYYRVKVNINTLGGANYGEPVELTDCSWEVLPWGESRLDAEIHEIRYLEITQKQKDQNDGETYQAIMNNMSKVTISYNSSHRIYLKDLKISYWNFNTSDYIPQKVNILSYRENSGSLKGTIAEGSLKTDYIELTKEQIEQIGEENINGIYIDHEKQTITIYHELYPLEENSAVKRYTKIGDKPYSPYYIEFTLGHEDEKNVEGTKTEKTYKVKQYPGIYVTFDQTPGTTINQAGNRVPIGFRVGNGGGLTSGSQGRYGVYVNGSASGTWDTGNRYTENQAPNSLQLGGIGGNGLPSNKNMYVIHITQLSEDESTDIDFYDGNTRETRKVNFHIGDPRTKFVNNNLGGSGALTDIETIGGWDGTSYNYLSESSRNNFRKVPAQTGSGLAQRLYNTEEKTLRYYYPTVEGTLDEEAFMLAPVIRLSSGYTELFQGTYGTENLSRENARRRCAALQDNGYPAGRWRLPTIGEIYFFKMLKKKNVLPEIFTNQRAYWSAQYLSKFDRVDNADIRPYTGEPGSALPSDHKFVRCVYDDWYWIKADGVTPDIIENNTDKIQLISGWYTDGDIREMFVWGDKEKNNPQEQPTGN